MKNIKKDIKEYLDKPYSFIVNRVSDKNGIYYVARVLELDGLIGTGSTYDEAYNDVKDAMESYIETKIANNIFIPEPIDTNEFSGKFVLRLPKTFHKLLSKKAMVEGVSLNQYALYKLSC